MFRKHRFLKSLGAAFLLEVSLIIILQAAGKILINPAEVAENVILFVIWLSFFTLIFYKSDFILGNKPVLFKILGLVGILLLAIILDGYLDIPDNPLSISLLVIFWLGIIYLILPAFFKKYALIIGGMYLLILAYFTYARLSSVYSVFTSESKETAILLFFLPIPFVIMLWVYEQWKWINSLKSAKANAELALLKTQINPHFFFNTLNNLYALTVNQSDKAPDVVLRLSDMMRYTIYEGEKDLVKLSDEVAYLENYIELNQIRYKKRVDIEFHKHIEEDLQIAPLMFIIILENAFKHGVDSLTDNAFISINLRSSNKRLEFTVRNNYERSEQSTNPGIGLKNLRQRLDLSYPGKHSLTCQSEDHVYSITLRIDC